jgi:hypothetical protein
LQINRDFKVKLAQKKYPKRVEFRRDFLYTSGLIYFTCSPFSSSINLTKRTRSSNRITARKHNEWIG